MNSEIKIANKQELVSEQAVSEQGTKPAWRAPVFTRIDIKRTMFTSGSFFDGVTLGLPS